MKMGIVVDYNDIGKFFTILADQDKYIGFMINTVNEIKVDDHVSFLIKEYYINKQLVKMAIQIKKIEL